MQSRRAYILLFAPQHYIAKSFTQQASSSQAHTKVPVVRGPAKTSLSAPIHISEPRPSRDASLAPPVPMFPAAPFTRLSAVDLLPAGRRRRDFYQRGAGLSLAPRKILISSQAPLTPTPPPPIWCVHALTTKMPLTVLSQLGSPTKGEMTRRCSLCNEEFRRSEHLERHLLRHIGARPLSCDTCGADFARRGGSHVLRTR